MNLRNSGAHKSGGNAASKSGGNAASKSGGNAASKSGGNAILNEPMTTRSGGARKSGDKAAPILNERMATRSGGARKSGGKVASIPKPEPPRRKNAKSVDTGGPTTSLGGLDLLKRKSSESNTIQAISKRSKKGKPEQEDENTVDENAVDENANDFNARRDIIQILNPLLNGIANLSRLFASCADETWYAELMKCKDTLENLCQTVSNRVELLNHHQLKSSFTVLHEDKSHDKSHDKALAEHFRDLEKLRTECITESKSFPPSVYCQTPIWQKCQDFPNLAIRAGRNGLPITFPLPLALLHPAFRIFVYHMRYPPSLKFTEATVASKASTTKLIHVAKCVDILLLSMPGIYWSHDQRLQAFRAALVIAFPENNTFEWYTNCTTSLDPSNPAKARERVDLVYRHRKTLVPSIFAEVKLEPGKGGDPFWQNGRIYQLYVQNNPRACENGAPVFFIQLSGTTFICYGFYITYAFFSRHIHGNRWCLL